MCCIQLAFYFHILTKMHGQNHIKFVLSTFFIRTRVSKAAVIWKLTYEDGARHKTRGNNEDVCVIESSWNVTAHGDAREGKWTGNWRMELVASTLHTTSEHGVSSITTADARASAVSSRLNWHPRRFRWTCPFRRKTKYGFCACAITFKLASHTAPRSF